MKKLLTLFAAFLFCLPETVLAFGHTTVLQEHYADGNAEGVVPYVDGLKEQYLENNLNHVIKEKANALGKEAGGKAVLSYQITVNRPTLFSVILKAEGDKTVYDGLNLDTTSGKEVEPRDLLYTNTAEYTEKLLGKDFVFGENGILLPAAPGGAYTTSVPYASLVKSINVAEGARLLTSYKLTQDAADKTLVLHPGELVALYLDANPTTGNTWQLLDQSSQGGFANLGHSFYLPMVNESGQNGSPGSTILFLSFTQAGDYNITAEYAKTINLPLKDIVFNFKVI